MHVIRRVKRDLLRVVKGAIRRRTDALIPSGETRQYRAWIRRRAAFRVSFYNAPLRAGLLSILTAVWDGSPLSFLKELAESLESQNEKGTCEWIILDNGCSNRELTGYLDKLRSRDWIRVIRSEDNIGIIRALRLCLESAASRYVLPVDADDWIYPDALRVITWNILEAAYPPLLYTDEDKIVGKKFYQPYLKPGWDPVLLLNSAYIAHLGVVDRKQAITLGAYSDPRAEASPDWDLFVRFLIAGLPAVHIPEVVYSWRVHAHSTADDAASKPRVDQSQQAVLQRYLDSRADGGAFEIRNSPLLPGAAHWHFVSKHKRGVPIQTVLLRHSGGGLGVHESAQTVRAIAARDGFVQFVGEDVDIENPDWISEVETISALWPDAVMIGGRIRNRKGIITDAGRYFGVCGVCGCPHRGRSANDPGYSSQIWKQRSVSAVFTQFAVVKAGFLLEALDELPAGASLAFLGAWLGAEAWRKQQRVVYSPFLSGVSEVDWEPLSSADEQELFMQQNRDLIPDHRFYPRGLSLTKGFAFGDSEYAPAPEMPYGEHVLH